MSLNKSSEVLGLDMLFRLRKPRVTLENLAKKFSEALEVRVCVSCTNGRPDGCLVVDGDMGEATIAIRVLEHPEFIWVGNDSDGKLLDAVARIADPVDPDELGTPTRFRVV